MTNLAEHLSGVLKRLKCLEFSPSPQVPPGFRTNKHLWQSHCTLAQAASRMLCTYSSGLNLASAWSTLEAPMVMLVRQLSQPTKRIHKCLQIQTLILKIRLSLIILIVTTCDKLLDLTFKRSPSYASTLGDPTNLSHLSPGHRCRISDGW